MRMDRAQLKQAARQNMRESRPSPLKVTLIFLLLTSVVSLLVDFVVANPAAGIYRMAYVFCNGGDYQQLLETWGATGASVTMLTIFLNILIFLYNSVLNFGYYAYSLRRTDKAEGGWRDLLCGFSQVGRVILMQLVILGFTVVWALAVVIPATMIGGLAMVAFVLIMGENVAGLLLSLCLFYLLILAAMFFAIYLTMRYALAPYILADHPEISGMEAVRRSRTMMRGRLGEGFKLTLSFLGWQLLGGLISGVVNVILFFVMSVTYYSSWDPMVLVVGAYALAIAGTLVTLPYQMWFMPYYYGTFAQYYRTISSKEQDVQALLEADRPEPF